MTVRLDEAGIEYEVEVDDSGITQMNPGMVPTYGGTAGLGCKLRLFVQPVNFKQAKAILDSLFLV